MPSAHVLVDKVINAVERFLHVEAVGGIVLLACAALALGWANSPWADSYHHFWDMPLTIAFGELSITRSLHFVINDGLMTVFFLVVGMEIRREIHEGALATWRAAALPLAGALGGVAAPAAIFLALSADPVVRAGWAVPTATDIAFAVGVLALLGKSIPSSIRIFLLALAIIDDIAAVIIIALFYSGGLDYSGLMFAAFGIALVFSLQAIGISNAFIYVLPGAIVWWGFLKTGVHPTLAGVVLGLITPVVARPMREKPIDLASNAVSTLRDRFDRSAADPKELSEPLRDLRSAQRELLAPVVRVQMALHTWVAYAVMPLFALANAGVSINNVNVSGGAGAALMLGVAAALVVGKPLGIITSSWLAVKLRLCERPEGVSWLGVALVGCLGGIGFTMSIFIATLAFADARLLAAAKLGVLAASLLAGVLGFAIGRYYCATQRPARSGLADGLEISRAERLNP